jgi:hypothetical protein
MFRHFAVTSVAFLVAVSTAPVSRAAPLDLASIPVSLVVQESCVVQSADAAISAVNQPVVSCIHDAPFEITQAGFDPALAQANETGRRSSAPVMFATTSDAQQTVWTVNF